MLCLTGLFNDLGEKKNKFTVGFKIYLVGNPVYLYSENMILITLDSTY